MTAFSIRHSHDEQRDRKKNFEDHRHDHPITPVGRKMAAERFIQLIKKIGVPQIIYCSPFKRGIETVKYMIPRSMRSSIRIMSDTRLSRFFNSKEQKDPSIFPETKKKNVPIRETKKQFHTRIEDFIKSMMKEGNIGSKKNVWFITHALVHKYIAGIYNVTIPEHIPFLHCFEVKKGGKEIKVENKEEDKENIKHAHKERRRAKKMDSEVPEESCIDVGENLQEKRRGFIVTVNNGNREYLMENGKYVYFCSHGHKQLFDEEKKNRYEDPERTKRRMERKSRREENHKKHEGREHREHKEHREHREHKDHGENREHRHREHRHHENPHREHPKPKPNQAPNEGHKHHKREAEPVAENHENHKRDHKPQELAPRKNLEPKNRNVPKKEEQKKRSNRDQKKKSSPKKHDDRKKHHKK